MYKEGTNMHKHGLNVRSTGIAILLATFLSSSPLYSADKKIRDLIKVVNVTSGSADTIVVSDLFYAGKYDITFSPNMDVNAEYLAKDNSLVLKSKAGFEGLTLVEFTTQGARYQIPVNVNVPQTQKFQYKAAGGENSVFLFGSFNGWNRSSQPMKDDDKDGIYETTIQVEPGRYEYKYFIDGNEIVDPANPEKVSNGMGSFNNIVNVPPRHTDKSYLHLLGDKKMKNGIVFTFMYEKQNQKEKLSLNNIIALLNNTKIEPKNILIRENTISVTLNNKLMTDEDVLRIAVRQGGQNTNVQCIMLRDGKPVSGTGAYKDWHDAVIYSIMIDRFSDGSKSNNNPLIHPQLSDKANYQGGDLQGILDRLQEGYFDSLGVNTLWLSPVYDNTNNVYQEFPEPHRYFTGYHGYWPTDNFKVEEHFGDTALLKKVIDEAHKRNMRVLLDFVANHVHIEHPLFKQHPDWFGSFTLPDGRKNLRLWDEFRLTTWFETYLPKFDYERSAAARDYMTDNAVWWLKQVNADGFRQDAVKHIPYLFWRDLTRKIKQEIEILLNKKIYQIGETFGSYDLISSYVNNGQLSAQFNFNLYDTAIPVFTDSAASFSGLNNQMNQTFSVYGVNHLMGNLMDSHDKARFIAYADGDIAGDPGELAWNNPPKVDNPDSYMKTQLYLAYLAAIPGLPVVYYGDEIGMTGATDPDNRRMMRFGKDLDVNEQQMLKATREIFNIRKSSSALKYGDFQTLIAEKNIYAFLRSDAGQRVLVVLNKGAKQEEVKIDLPVFYKIKSGRDLAGRGNYEIASDRITVPLPAYGWRMIELK